MSGRGICYKQTAMPRRYCHRHGPGFGPCSCGMGRLSRMVEPTVLYLLATGKARYGYELMERAHETGLTDSEIDAAAVYRTLRTLEQNGYVVSRWQPGPAGPDRRLYEITPEGREHLQEWATLLERLGGAMLRFAERCRELI